MELRHLRYFIAVAEELHFTRAARRIGIAQPPLTQQIKALEKELGVQLLDRKPGNVSLTSAGHVFLEEARAVVEQLGRAVLRTRVYARGLAGRLAVGFTESSSFSPVVTSTLRQYREQYTDVELSLTENRSLQLIEALRSDKLQAAFVRLPLELEDDLCFQLISDEAMVVAVSKNHPLAARRHVIMQDLKNEAFILYPRANRLGITAGIIAACETAGFSPMVVQRAPQISATINLVASSLGIAIVPQCMRTSRQDAVKYLPLRDSGLRTTLGIAYRKSDASFTLQNLLSIIHTVKPSRPNTPDA